MNVKFPVAVWEDAQGMYTASVLDGQPTVATDASISAALLQLKRYLTWLAREQGHLSAADFDDLELRDHRVRLRPEYRIDDCAYPVNRPYELRITCVHGQRRDGSRHCVAPTLGLRLSYQPSDPIEELLAEAVQQVLGRLTPQQLSRELMPGAVQLDAVHVRNPGVRLRSDDEQHPTLQSVAERLGDRSRARRQHRALRRDAEVQQLAERLANEETSLLLLGEGGVGKTTVLLEAIRQLPRRAVAKGKETKDKADSPQRRFWLTSGARLIAGMKYLGQWEERCELVIAELADNGSVLCVANLLELVRVGAREPSGSVAAFLVPYIERGELRLVAEATTAELDACRQLLPGFSDLFQIVRVPEFSAADGRVLLDTLLEQGAHHKRLELETGLAGLIYRLFKRFQPYAAFPGRSAAFVRHLLDDAARSSPTRLTQHDVLQRFQRESGLPEVLLRDDLPLPHVDVLNTFRQAVLHQEAACQAAASVVTALKSGLNDPQRPLGVLLFCGPTGVGKTEMAKAMARFLFGAGESQDRLVRLDMSEYSALGSARRLFENAEGQLSDLVQRVRRQPFVVVLLDEIEKAAPDVLDALLGVLDEGRLTDRFGRTTTFRSAVIVMTSNLGAERSSAIGFDVTVQPDFERIALQTFRPEFFNRIDSVITFQPLSAATIRELAQRELEAVARREGLAKHPLRLTWTDAVVDRLAAIGFDARYGARPLQRAVEQAIVAPLAKLLLSGPFETHDVVQLDVSESLDIVCCWRQRTPSSADERLG